jgi:4-amino-4-deoxy-L-arabinose transferase-like glycosyltransferase
MLWLRAIDDDDDDNNKNNNNNNNNKLQFGFYPWQRLIYMHTIATKFTSGGPHEKLVVSTCSVGNQLSIAFRQRETKKNLC